MYPPQQPILFPPYPRRSFALRLFSVLAKSIIALCVVLGISALVLWLVYRPHEIEVSVHEASLRTFNFDPDRNILYFNLTANVTIHNPNKKIVIYYDWLESDASYGGARFAWAVLPPFYQSRENTTMLGTVFGGQSSYIGKVLNEFRRENATGLFNITLWLHCRVRYKFGSLATRRYMVRVRCGLALRLVSNGTSHEHFTSTRCDVVDF